jgi:F0F1-type ATP synthase delta subunit
MKKDAVKDLINTENERNLLLNFLDQLREKIYNLNIDVKSFIDENVSQEMANSMFELFGNDVQTRNVESISVKIDSLKDEISQIPSVFLTIPFEAQEQLVKRISEWFIHETDEKVILEFKKDESLIGGAVVEWNGRVTEWSIRKWFRESENRAQRTENSGQ